MNNLYIVATPIGNLEDITLRALEILRTVDVIVAEDKRVTIKLLNKFQISKKLLVWQQHSSNSDWQRIKNELTAGHDIAYVSDAGTPGISDPGGQLIQKVLAEFPEVKITPLPGASALSTIISVAGIQIDRFIFLGFLPHKKGRQTMLEMIKKETVPVIFFESVHRILKALEQLSDCPKKLIVGRELTKQFETIYRGTASEILEVLNKDKTKIKGEFVVIVDKI
jgi:16S rRNA (cytidine1402-2'-O)-methyltransferase